MAENSEREPDINNQVEYWDRVADEKVFTIGVDLAFLRREVPANGRVLDYGCGYGRICDMLQRAGYARVIGVDTSAEMIGRGHELFPGCDLRHLVSGPGRLDGRGSTLPAAAGDSFDAILLVAVLTCIPEDAAQKHLIRDLVACLRDGGLLLISDFVLQDDQRNRERYAEFAEEFGTYGVFRLPEGAVVRHHSLEWFDELTTGLAEIHRAFPRVTTMNGHQARSIQWAGRKPAVLD
jgi:SAM-dependent methyltransferase